jgi:hypothetical protein
VVACIGTILDVNGRYRASIARMMIVGSLGNSCICSAEAYEAARETLDVNHLQKIWSLA